MNKRQFIKSLIGLLLPSVGHSSFNNKSSISNNAESVRYITDFSSVNDAFSWLSSICDKGISGKLIFPAGNYSIKTPIILPNASGWIVEPYGQVRIVQESDNSPIMEMLVNQTNSNFQIGGTSGTFVLTWENSQPATNIRSIGIALGATKDVEDGIYNFKILNIKSDKGFRTISIHPTTVAGKYKFPIWGFTINDISSYQSMTGATIYLQSPNPNVGSPRAEISNFYCQGKNSIEPRLYISGIQQLVIKNAEFNYGAGNQATIQNCRQVIIENIRLEHGQSINNYEKLFVFSGSDQQTTIINMELQSHTLNIENEAYLIDSDQGYVSVNNIECLDIATTSGKMILLNSSSKGIINYEGDVIFSNEHDTYLHNINSAEHITAKHLTQEFFSKSQIDANLKYISIPYNNISEGCTIGILSYLIGIHVYMAVPLTAGSIEVDVYKDGVSIGEGQYITTITEGKKSGSRYHPSYKSYMKEFPTDHKFRPGNHLTVKLKTDTNYLAINNTINILAIFAIVPR